MSETDAQTVGVDLRPKRGAIDDILTQSFKYGAIFGVPIFIVLAIPMRRRGIESGGIGLRGALIALAIVAVPFLLWVIYNLGMRHLASTQATPTEFRVVRWWGGRSTLVPQSASKTAGKLRVVGGQGRTIKFSPTYWDTQEVANALQQYNISDPKPIPVKQVSALVGLLMTLGGLLLFVLVVGLIVNVAARL